MESTEERVRVVDLTVSGRVDVEAERNFLSDLMNRMRRIGRESPVETSMKVMGVSTDPRDRGRLDGDRIETSEPQSKPPEALRSRLR